MAAFVRILCVLGKGAVKGDVPCGAVSRVSVCTVLIQYYVVLVYIRDSIHRARRIAACRS